VDSIDEVAEAAGFDTPETLRFHFRRAFGVSPTSYRKRFSTARDGAVVRAEIRQRRDAT
jgi:transcriptional regulator GlxA family with amidase domain